MITQADIARAIRAVRAAGLQVRRVVVRSDGVTVETLKGEQPEGEQGELAQEQRVVVL